MILKFKKLIFSNILSYGNSKTEFNFSTGLNCICGSNSNGKSTIFEALTFALYGKPYRNIKIKELINNKNKKRLYTEILFDIGLDSYRIIRTLEPSSLIVEKNGTELELLSSKSLIQDEINKLIGIDYEFFKQIISISINHNKPFLSIPVQEKRDIIEQIFNIKIFGEMQKIAKKNNSGLKQQHEINKKTSDILEESIKSMRKQILSNKEVMKNFEANKLADIDAENRKIEKQETLLTDIVKEKNEWKEKEFDLSTLTKDDSPTKELNEIMSKISENNLLKRQNEKELAFLDKNTVCSNCHQEINPEFKEKQITNYRQKQTEIADNLVQLDTRKNELNRKIEEIKLKEADFKLKEKELLNIKHQTQMLTIKETGVRSALKALSDNVESIKTRSLSLNLDELEDLLKRKIDEYQTFYASVKELAKKIKNNDLVLSILSDTGIKSFFFKKLIPIFNSKINEYLNKFDLSLNIQFDEQMQETIKNFGGTSRTEEINYYSLSEGEKKRIDVAILFSFNDIVKLICNWSSNLFSIDELLDTSLDSDGLDKIIGCIKTLTTDNEISIYLISHRLMENEAFTKIYQVRKVGGFSKIYTDIN